MICSAWMGLARLLKRMSHSGYSGALEVNGWDVDLVTTTALKATFGLIVLKDPVANTSRLCGMLGFDYLWISDSSTSRVTACRLI